MKEILTAKLVYTNPSQRYYRLSSKVNKFPYQNFNIVDEVEYAKKRFKPEYNFLQELVENYKDGTDLIVISDATTHTERLAFCGFEYSYNNEQRYSMLGSLQIDGKHTMMIHGGDSRHVHSDGVYLRRIASINGYSFKLE